MIPEKALKSNLNGYPNQRTVSYQRRISHEIVLKKVTFLFVLVVVVVVFFFRLFGGGDIEYRHYKILSDERKGFLCCKKYILKHSLCYGTILVYYFARFDLRYNHGVTLIITVSNAFTTYTKFIEKNVVSVNIN